MVFIKKIILFCFIFILSSSFSQELIHIQIFSASKLSSLKIFIQQDYSVQFGDTGNVYQLNKNRFYKIEVYHDSLILIDHVNEKKIVTSKIRFIAPDVLSSQFSVLTNQSLKERTFKGHLLVTANGGYLKLINSLDIDDYVCGVVNAEVGKGRHPEFYKAQALLVRTYALSHFNKHASEGFNLCDQVHCQVYYGICQSSNILKAVEETHDLILVDDALNLIIAAFHSNSGGQTVNSEDIWGSKKNYLRSVNDTFSIGMPSYKWKKKISVNEWINYLKKNKYPVYDSNALKFAMNFKQDTRKVFLQYNGTKIPLKNIRDDLKLMSTFFSINLNDRGDSVIFNGRGFGHGVGLSQEGAMKMASYGWNYKQIIDFYYQNVMMIDLKKLNFFKEE